MIKATPVINFLKKARSFKTTRGCVMGMSIVGMSGHCLYTGSHTPITEKVLSSIAPNVKAPKNARNAIKWTEEQKKLAEYKKAMLVEQKTAAKKNPMNELLLKIIEDDQNRPKNLNSRRLADNIVKISEEYGANPVHIACIIKKETHFTENAASSTAKGLMQITEISVKDMYQRPDIYHKKLKQITTKYKNYKQLFKALASDPILNLRIGTILYLAKLDIAKGNVKTALVNYNGSKRKYSYAKDVYSEIVKYQAKLPASKKYIARK